MSQNQQVVSPTSTKPKSHFETAPWLNGLVFFGLILAGVGARLLCRDIPNFAPVAALALFAGYFFTSRILAIMIPLLVMLVSDFILGAYNPGLMIVVYGMLTLPVMLRGLLRKHLNFRSDRPKAIAFSSLGIIGCSVMASLAFFFVTNLAVWYQASWYTRDAAGLWQCYLQALPFFRYTLSGDLLFTTVLFGGHALVTARGTILEPVSAEQA